MNKYQQIFRLRAVHLMAFFIFTYVGVEVTIGGAPRFKLLMIHVTRSYYDLDGRLDCHVRDQRATWRPQLGIYLVWVLRR